MRDKTTVMKKSKEECLLLNGVMAVDLGKYNDKVLQAMDDFSNESNNNLPRLENQLRIHWKWLKEENHQFVDK